MTLPIQWRAALPRINSMTKYPSIPTYHTFGDRGRLTETRNVIFDSRSHLVVTEKVDGVNARIIVLPYGLGYLIGSREELLHYAGDIIPNPTQGIVDITAHAASRIVGYTPFIDYIDPHSLHARMHVYYGEVYGAAVTDKKAARRYQAHGQSGFRIFDVLDIPRANWGDILFADGVGWSRDAIAAARDNDGIGHWLSEAALETRVNVFGLALTPRLFPEAPLPDTISDTYAWLTQAGGSDWVSQANLGGGNGQPEGVVVRTPDRQHITKIRFEEYRRTIAEQK